MAIAELPCPLELEMTEVAVVKLPCPLELETTEVAIEKLPCPLETTEVVVAELHAHYEMAVIELLVDQNE
jgi:hypothetical protein